jgi:hypothetical protein
MNSGELIVIDPREGKPLGSICSTQNMSEKSGGGFHFGNVGGNVSQSAGGDIVGGDKTTTTTTQVGFADEEKKQQFHSEIEQLREALRAMKTEIEASASLDQDKKDEVISEILAQVKALKEAKEKTAEVPPGKAAPPNVATEIKGTLDRAGGIVDKLQNLAGKAGDVAETVSKFAVKYGPLILSARHLFGLP